MSGWSLVTGGKLWSVQTKQEFGARGGFFGLACSPLVEGNVVIVNVGGRNGAGIMAFDTATGTVPIAGDIVDTFFPGQLMAARALQKHIESTHWVEDAEANARASGDHEMHEARVENDPTLKRIVYLHD